MSETSVRGGVAIIVIGGAVLGLLYNGVGLATRPPRGIAWIAKEDSIPSLEGLIDTTATGSVEPAPAPSATAPPEPSSGTTPAPSTSSPSGTSPSTTARPSHDPGSAKPGATTQTPSGTAATKTPPAPTTSAPPVPEPRATAPLPFIPESSQPIKVELAMTKRFFDARGALFVDARDQAEYDKGHIPGAIRLTNPEAQNEPERMKALPVNGRPTIVYCEGGACEASLDLARFLLESGFKKVLVYMGGYPEWEAAGNAVTRGSAP